mmetsp:Transcript_1171/g.2798  ORF Transcript_1171/g.2798 Transcript_1171/m.2798 type:complete len:221 (-) Transcript_1171:1509-2171(-)
METLVLHDLARSKTFLALVQSASWCRLHARFDGVLFLALALLLACLLLGHAVHIVLLGVVHNVFVHLHIALELGKAALLLLEFLLCHGLLLVEYCAFVLVHLQDHRVSNGKVLVSGLPLLGLLLLTLLLLLDLLHELSQLLLAACLLVHAVRGVAIDTAHEALEVSKLLEVCKIALQRLCVALALSAHVALLLGLPQAHKVVFFVLGAFCHLLAVLAVCQ